MRCAQRSLRVGVNHKHLAVSVMGLKHPEHFATKHIYVTLGARNSAALRQIPAENHESMLRKSP